MENLFARLTDNEVSMITDMRLGAADTAYNSGFNNNQNPCSTMYFLRYWDEAKSQNSWMMKMFADNLILSKNIKFKESEEELRNKAYEIMDGSNYRMVRDDAMRLIERLNPDWEERKVKDETMDNPNWWWGWEQDCHSFSIHDCLVYYLFDLKAIITNTYEGPNCEFFIGEDKIFKLRKGMKFGRILTKLGQGITSYWPRLLHPEVIEDLQQECSRVRNTAEINAKLCLSIHPLDYLTASWNDCNWRSCMNFDDGEYRRGVIEMMNSPYVIVAYTTSSEDMALYNGSWNSKKWREFFIVNPTTGVFGIKGYPYWNQSLEMVTLDWIRELLTTDNMKFTSNFVYQYVSDVVTICNYEAEIEKIRFHCGPAMYNDFYGSNKYVCMLRTDFNQSNIELNYSGKSICVLCGEENEFENEGCVACYECCEIHTCSKCGDTICDPDNLYTVHGYEFCQYCYDDLPICDICNEICLPEDWEEFDSIHEFGIGYGVENDEFLTDSFNSNRPLTICSCARCAHKLIDAPTAEASLDKIKKAPTRSTYWHYIPIIHPNDLDMEEFESCVLSDVYNKDNWDRMQETHFRNLKACKLPRRLQPLEENYSPISIEDIRINF